MCIRDRRHIEEHAAQPQEERDNMKAKSKEYADEVVITGVEQQRPTEILFFQQTCSLALRLKRRYQEIRKIKRYNGYQRGDGLQLQL